MSTNVPNQVSFLKTARNFPNDLKQLTVEVNKAYIDIASSVNNTTKSLFSVNVPALNGENWFLNQNQRQQGFRQIYMFTAAGNINHGLKLGGMYGYTRIYGTFTDGTNWYPLPYVDVVDATNQVNIIVTPTEIQITAGGGTPPAITQGTVVLEWISQP
jgi:hypothetical protein